MKQLRPFVEWDVDLRKQLTPAEKRRITLYHNQLEELRNRAHILYRPRSKAAKEAAIEYAAGNGNVLKGFKAIPVPVTDPSTAKVSFRKGKGIAVKTSGGSRKFIPFSDPVRLAKEPREYVNELIKNHNQEYFQISVGLHESLGTFHRKFVAERIEKLMMNYNTAKDWVRGLYGVTLGKQVSIEEYLKARGDARNKAQKTAKARKRRNAKDKTNNRR